MNKVVLMGRLTKDPEVKYGKEEKSDVARYTLAVNRKYKSEDEDADFIRCVVFGKAVEFVEKYLKKGMKISVVGRIQTGRYEKDGETHYTTDVIVEEHEFAEPKKEDGGNSGRKRSSSRR